MIFMVVATLLFYRGAQDQRRRPRGHGRRVRLARGGRRARAPRRDRQRVAADPRPLGPRRGHPGLPADRAAQQAPAHLRRPDQRVLLAPPRRPRARCCAMYSGTEKIDFEDPADDAIFGRGRIEDFTWKGLLDMATCTECGRCQSQCPAWNTEKPLSPKLMIMNLRDHAFTKAPYIKATQAKLDGKNVEFGEVDDEVLATMSEKVAGRGRPPADRRARLRSAPRRPTATTPPATARTRARSSTTTPCGRAPRAARASTSARSTSSTSTTSSTCAATR